MNKKQVMTFQLLDADGITKTAFNNILNNEISMEWGEFKKTFKPSEYSAKELLSAIIPASVLKEPIFTVSDKQGIEQPRRCRENIKQYYALFLDFDGELQIDDFIKSHVDMEYILYTTSSSTTEVNRFRVVIPLTKPVEFTEIERRKEQLANKFNLYKDMSTFSCSRLFYLPSKDSDIHFNTGKFFDLFSVEKTIIKIRIPTFYQQSEDSIKRARDRACMYIEEIKKLHFHKLHHPQLLAIVGAMQSAGLDAIIDNVINHIKDPKSTFNLNQAKRSVKSGHYTAGTLGHYAKVRDA